MAAYFFDTSALVKYYHPEAGSDRVAAIFGENGRRVLISKLGFLEIQSVFAIKVRTGQMDREDAGLQRANLFIYVADRAIEVFQMTSEHFTSAERLVGRYSFVHRVRTLDALQLAVALDLRESGQLDHFVAADKALLEVARLEGFSVLNPEEAF